MSFERAIRNRAPDLGGGEACRAIGGGGFRIDSRRDHSNEPIALGCIAISDEKYVLLTTGFTTDPDVGKVKRIRNTQRVTLQACSATGRVKPGAEIVEAKASMKLGADAGPIHKAIRRKYWVMVPLPSVPSFFARLVRRKKATDCAIQLTFEH